MTAVLLVLAMPDEAEFLKTAVLEAGMLPTISRTCASGVALAATQTFDVLVVDRSLPDAGAIALCTALRAIGNTTPIVILGAGNALSDRVEGLNAGADDYVVKPFVLAELMARLGALVRRSAYASVVKLGVLEIDRLKHRVSIDGDPIDLTGIEYRLLGHLANQAGAVVDRQTLLHAVWPPHEQPGAGVVEVHISRLRDKLGKQKRLIETVRRRGYRLQWPQSA